MLIFTAHEIPLLHDGVVFQRLYLQHVTMAHSPQRTMHVKLNCRLIQTGNVVSMSVHPKPEVCVHGLKCQTAPSVSINSHQHGTPPCTAKAACLYSICTPAWDAWEDSLLLYQLFFLLWFYSLFLLFLPVKGCRCALSIFEEFHLFLKLELRLQRILQYKKQ